MAKCVVCSHPEREAIDAALRAGGAENSVRKVAERFGLGKSAVGEHRACIGLKTAPEAPPQPSADIARTAADSQPEETVRAAGTGPDSPRTVPPNPTPPHGNVSIPRVGPGRRCTVCDHPQRTAIDEALVGANLSFRTIADRFDLSHQAAMRHMDNHIPALMAMAREEAVAEHGESMLANMAGLRERGERLFAEAEGILDKAKELANYELGLKAVKVAADALGKLLSAAELIARVTGELRDKQQTVNILVNSAGFPELVGGILVALEGHPEAQAKVKESVRAQIADRRGGVPRMLPPGL